MFFTPSTNCVGDFVNPRVILNTPVRTVHSVSSKFIGFGRKSEKIYTDVEFDIFHTFMNMDGDLLGCYTM
jgi:hypothetical protein